MNHSHLYNDGVFGSFFGHLFVGKIVEQVMILFTFGDELVFIYKEHDF